MISLNLQREIYNNTKEIIETHLKEEKEKLSRKYVGKYICAKSVFAEGFQYMGQCLGVNVEFKYTKNVCDSAQKMFCIILIMDRQIGAYNDTTSLDLTKCYVHSFEAFETEEDALLYCEVER